MAEQTPRVLNDRYEIHRRLARGGMAQVYLSRDRSLDRPVAVKELVPEFAADPSFVERFRREAQAAANLAHPNVVGVYDWGTQDGTYFIVMEYVDGPSLSQVLRSDGPIHPRRAAEIASEVASGLGFAHSRGVVHRDIKPGNVLLTKQGQCKVTDFGIARALSSPDDELTQAGSVMGTATYFSPEQAQGLPVDPRSDLYSLGVVLYEMVAGRPPFSGDSPLAIAYKHVQDEPAPPSQFISDLPAGLEAIILKLLEKQPDHRYSSAEDLRADLARYLAGEETVAERDLGLVAVPLEAATTMQPATTVQPVAAPEPEPVEEEPQDEPKSRTALFIGALVVLLILLGGLLFWFANSLDSGNQVAVPPVVGLSLTNATAKLTEAGLKVDTEPRASDSVEVGHVIAQDPDRDVEVDEGSTVKLIVSTGQELIKVADVRTLPQAEAEQTLKDQGLRVKVTTQESDTVDSGLVVDQNPAPETEVNADAEVEIFVSKGVGEELVPDVINKPLAQAQAELQAAGFRFGRATSAPNPFIGEGSVVSTDPPGGTSAAKNTEVQIVVSSGPEQARVPTVTGQSENAATSTLKDAGFDVAVKTQSVPAGDADAGRVISQDPKGGTTVNAGSTVTIVVGVEAAPTTTTTTSSSSTTTSTP